MRPSTRVAALCVGLLFSCHAAAAELPQRWVSAGGALSEWVSALVGSLGPRLPDALKSLADGFFPGSAGQ